MISFTDTAGNHVKIIGTVDPPDVYQSSMKNVAKYNFQVKAIIQDILECRDSMETLNKLNEKGRVTLNLLREELEVIDMSRHEGVELRCSCPVEIEALRYQLANLLKEFKEANIRSMFAIEKAQREELLKPSEEDSGVRNRSKKVDRDGLVQMSSGVTEQLLSISRHLADTTQRSQDTLDSLVSSSSTVHVCTL